MPDIDLIPADYRRARWLKVWLRQIISSGAAMLTVTLVAFGFLSIQVKELRAEAAQLEKQRAVTEQQRQDLEQLDSQKKALSQQLSLLSSLRSGAPARSMFMTVDKALANADVWFLQWEFRRAGVKVPESQARGVETGYFIVVPESGEAGGDQAWLVETHMKITGQARDHEALSRFVKGLYMQSSVVDVSVQRTDLSRLRDRDVVQFDLAVVLNSEARG
ncbi:MAG: hypothetical protein QNJ73_04615 [Gammaproteobacteria bacterium]|nr:hypothetical protein [Gammaproteobacteria bacterium]